MNEWQDMQKKPSTKSRDLFKNKKAKTSKLSELSKTEQNRLAKLNLIKAFFKSYLGVEIGFYE